MKLTVFNGSPRGKTGNTEILLHKFADGFLSRKGNNMEVLHLSKVKKIPEYAELARKSDTIIIAFPLYVHAMPGQVKDFIEALYAAKLSGNCNMGFIVQSGFPEGHHSNWVAQYLERLPAKLGCRYIGTVIKGGVEGIQVMPKWMTGKLFSRFRQLGEKFADTGQFDTEITKELIRPEYLNKKRLFLYKIMKKLGLANMYWNRQLKQNNAFEGRFATPYI